MRWNGTSTSADQLRTTLPPPGVLQLDTASHTSAQLLTRFQPRSRAGPPCCETAQVPRSDALPVRVLYLRTAKPHRGSTSRI